MSRSLSALLAGLLFGVGLGVAGMTDPGNIVGFLDLTGDWNPTLAFVMIGAIAVHAPLLWLVRKRSAPLFSDSFLFAARSSIDRPLVIGAATFGVGWGLGGFCPGPAIVALVGGAAGPTVFVGGMLAGMAIDTVVRRETIDEVSPVGTCG